MSTTLDDIRRRAAALADADDLLELLQHASELVRRFAVRHAPTELLSADFVESHVVPDDRLRNHFIAREEVSDDALDRYITVCADRYRRALDVLDLMPTDRQRQAARLLMARLRPASGDPDAVDTTVVIMARTVLDLDCELTEADLFDLHAILADTAHVLTLLRHPAATTDVYRRVAWQAIHSSSVTHARRVLETVLAIPEAREDTALHAAFETARIPAWDRELLPHAEGATFRALFLRMLADQTEALIERLPQLDPSQLDALTDEERARLFEHPDRTVREWAIATLGGQKRETPSGDRVPSR